MRLAFDVCSYDLIPRVLIGGSPRLVSSGGHEVDCLILCAEDYPYEAAGLRRWHPWHHVPLMDDGESPPAPRTLPAIRDALDVARQCHDRGGTVAFACFVGQNRSALLGALFLVERGMVPAEALAVTQRARTLAVVGWAKRLSPALSNRGFQRTVLGWKAGLWPRPCL